MHSPTVQRFGDLRRRQPAGRTLQNLLLALSAKLEYCAQLPVFEYEAAEEGQQAPAELFSRLIEAETRTINELAACLHEHLETTVLPTAGRSHDPED